MAGEAEMLGSLAGGVAGNIIAPGVGGLVGSKLGGMLGSGIGSGSTSKSTGSTSNNLGAGLGIATSLLQGFKANQSGKAAEAAMPDMIDPNQSSFLAELAQKRRSIETGADFEEAMKAAEESQATANDAIVRASGGDSGGAIQGLLQAQQVAGATKNKALAAGDQMQFGYNNLYNNLNNLISARQLELQLYKSDQARAQQATQQQGANQNFMAGISGLGSGSMPNLSSIFGGGSNNAAGFVGPDAEMGSSLSNLTELSGIA